MEHTVTEAEAAKVFVDILNWARAGEPTAITENGRTVARVEPVESEAPTGSEFARIWRETPRMDPENAEDFARTIEEARANLGPLKSAWD